MAAPWISWAALSFMPLYNVVVSVTNGIPPCSITRSTTVLTITGLTCVVFPYSPGWILIATISPSLTGEISGNILFTCSGWLSCGFVTFASLKIILFNDHHILFEGYMANSVNEDFQFEFNYSFPHN